MKKYRVKQIGEDYYPQYRFLWSWVSLTKFGNVRRDSSFKDAINALKVFEEEQYASRHVVRKTHYLE